MRGDSYNPPPAANNGYMSRDIYDTGPPAASGPGFGFDDPLGQDFRKRRRTPSPPGGGRQGGRWDPRPRYFQGPSAPGGPPPPFDDRGGFYRGGYDGPPRGDYRDRERDRGRERDFPGGGYTERGYNPNFGGPRRSMSPRRGYDGHPPQPGPDGRYPYPPPRNDGERPPDAAAGRPGADGVLSPDQREESVPPREFAEWYRTNHAEELKAKAESGEPFNADALIEQKYEEYRKDFLVRQNWALYLEHRDNTWFIEKYGTEEAMQQLRLHATRQGRAPAAQKYLEEVEKGMWDEVNYDASVNPAEVKKMKDGREANGVGTTLAPFEAKLVEVPAPPNQIFIKSIPPTIGRHALEAFLPSQPGFDHLAMSEPFLKKGCHRVGYVQFKEGTDVRNVLNAIDRTEVKEVTLQMSLNTVPFSGKTRENPAMSSSIARMKHDAAQAKAMALALENQLLMTEEERQTAINEGKTPEEVAKKEFRLLSRGSDVVQARIDTLIKQLEEFKAEESKTEDAKTEDTKMEEVKPEETKPEEAKEEDAKMDEAKSEGLKSEEANVEGSTSQDAKMEDMKTDEAKTGAAMTEAQMEREKIRIELDQWVSYLRNGLNSCYYCVAPMDFPEELYSKCLRHIRKVGEGVDEEPKEEEEEDHDMEVEARPVVTTDVDGKPLDIKMRPRPKFVNPIEKWTSRLDSKIKLIILPRSELDVKEFYGKDREGEINKIAKPLIKMEETSKYRCKNCSKLFKAPEFVHKHLTTKHPELFEHLNNELPMFDNFILDPKHIVPLIDQPASVNDKPPTSRPLHPPYDMSFGMSSRRGRNGFGDRGGRGGRGGSNRAGDFGGRGGFGGFNSPRGGYRGSRDGPPMGSPLNLTPGREDPRAKRGRVSYRDLDAAPPASTNASANTEGGGLDY